MPTIQIGTDELLNAALQLPQVELERFVQRLLPVKNGGGESKAANNGVTVEDQTHHNDAAAFAWINAHASEYIGQWLALEGDRLLAHGTDLREVAAAARAQGVPFPLLHLVEPPREHPYIHA